MSRVVTLLPAPLCESEVLRYAGCRKADKTVRDLLHACADEVLPLLTYAVCYDEIHAEPYTAQSQSLQKQLDGCERVYLLAATVGIAPDRLVAKYGRLSPSKAVMIQAIATERVEALCDAFAVYLHEQTGLFARGRFSAGYGDAKLSWQPQLIERLEATKRIGVTVNDSYLLSPTKSVTAFVGMWDTAEPPRERCRDCEKQDCAFRGAV